ncbi:chromosome partitioning protein ParB [Mergibacter septicus]|uniref:Chromosome partitioning protein ParB n=1 Tax=Mergibacter septicus TaxID=221402 RepID=A0A8E3MEK4_9PAST|nr:ParB family protein [Mergibacter septicus]AWX14696.1 chromosome partitioning protein ParB [Mergibacter septicus]QDJ13947.1 chromosome partitioning protein ParB [Mergibacter septicus]UTU48603.1 ParB N-terminal domain-containing protein [Mergibacter septicus]WMR95768.1 ParB N-terminal domain-containing protein [Mergibacter septicus]
MSNISREARKKSLLKGMSIGIIENNSPDYLTQQIVSDKPELKTVTLLELRSFDNNPRKTKNPKFNEIKESIRARGLDFPPNITKRPNDDFYIIADGGNTRLQALKELYEETQDPKFFSISCLFKPWRANNNQIDGELSCLIGHLAENDLRGDLTFIERALAIQQVKSFYEKRDNNSLSQNELAKKLTQDGYSISRSLITKMEQCINLLYPAIPENLMAGMGKPQIEKLLTLYNYAEIYWNKKTTFNEFKPIWLEILSVFNRDESVLDLHLLQDELIGKMISELDNSITYQEIHYEINIDTNHKQRLKIESEMDNAVVPVPETEPTLLQIGTKNKPKKSEKTISEKTTEHLITDETNSSEINFIEPVVSVDTPSNSNSIDEEIPETESELESLDISPAPVLSQFGMSPGLTFSEQRKQRAEQNGISFANTGCQPVEDIWQIFPAFDDVNKLKIEAFGLATDIAQQVGLKSLIQRTAKSTDFSFTVDLIPSDLTENQLTVSIYELLSMLATDDHSEQLNWNVNEGILLTQINDLMLVKIFRLIRVVRRLRELKS